MKRRKRVTYIVKDGRGVDWLGIERDFTQFLKNGKIVCTVPRDNREYAHYEIHDEDKKEVWEYDFGRVQGKAVIPLKVKVYFGKSDYVIVGYQMRKDGSYFHTGYELFRRGTNKAYDKSALKRLRDKTRALPEGDSLMLGWLLPDDVKDAIEAELREATSGKYRYEVCFDMI